MENPHTHTCAEVSRAESPRAAQQSSKHRHAAKLQRRFTLKHYIYINDSVINVFMNLF